MLQQMMYYPAYTRDYFPTPTKCESIIHYMFSRQSKAHSTNDVLTSTFPFRTNSPSLLFPST